MACGRTPNVTSRCGRTRRTGPRIVCTPSRAPPLPERHLDDTPCATDTFLVRSLLALAIVSLIACGHSTNGDTGDAAPPIDGGGSGQDAPPGDAGCGLVTCASAGAGCGLIGDGCGGTLDCGSCPTGQTCGG